MPRQLVRIPLSQVRLAGVTPIEPTYAKDYTPEQMRMWADDLARLEQTAPDEMARWRQVAPEALSAEQQRVLAVYAVYYGDSGARIKGSLREDGVVDLENGRHRVAYMQERGVECAPVWVWAADQRDLDRFSAECEHRRVRAAREVAFDQTRQGATMPGERPPTHADDGSRLADRLPRIPEDPQVPRTRPAPDEARIRALGRLALEEPGREPRPDRQVREERPTRSEERDGR